MDMELGVHLVDHSAGVFITVVFMYSELILCACYENLIWTESDWENISTLIGLI